MSIFATAFRTIISTPSTWYSWVSVFDVRSRTENEFYVHNPSPLSNLQYFFGMLQMQMHATDRTKLRLIRRCASSTTCIEMVSNAPPSLWDKKEDAIILLTHHNEDIRPLYPFSAALLVLYKYMLNLGNSYLSFVYNARNIASRILVYNQRINDQLNGSSSVAHTSNLLFPLRY